MKKIIAIQQLKTKLIFLSFFLLILLVNTEISAQKKWAFEMKPGINFPTKDLGDAKLKTGYGFEGVFSYKIMPQLAAYAGWGWNNFKADNSFAGSNVDFTETGYCFGLQFMHTIPKTFIGYMVKAGGTYNHIETENSDGKIINDTGHGLGWQVGVGLTVPFSKRFVLLPEVRYRSLSRDFTINETNTAVDLNYISVAVGVAYTF
jgi:opacity protein-like surface antigen